MNKTTNDTSVKRDSAFDLVERGVDDLRSAVALQQRVRDSLQRLDARGVHAGQRHVGNGGAELPAAVERAANGVEADNHVGAIEAD